MCNVAGIFFSEAYASNMKYMYTSAAGLIADCSDFIWGTYNSIVISGEPFNATDNENGDDQMPTLNVYLL